MIPASLRALLDQTSGQRRAEWAGREVWLANEEWGELALSLQGAQLLHFLPAPDAARAAGASPAPDAARAAGASPAPDDARAAGASPAPDAAQAAGARPAEAAEVPEGMAAGGWLWVTPTPQELPGAIRGGIPLCWPWFADDRYADESEDHSGPFHGTARQAQWRLDAVDEHEEGVELHLSPE
ncbi:MAG TPA: D-hexose-6-phosphate mutarotase, partial [Halomonas sp.]|nr:D-hexose-6-phosphate mutarotase [Halomonas sp.]